VANLGGRVGNAELAAADLLASAGQTDVRVGALEAADQTLLAQIVSNGLQINTERVRVEDLRSDFDAVEEALTDGVVNLSNATSLLRDDLDSNVFILDNRLLVEEAVCVALRADVDSNSVLVGVLRTDLDSNSYLITVLRTDVTQLQGSVSNLVDRLVVEEAATVQVIADLGSTAVLIQS
jgi:hypothetical protein